MKSLKFITPKKIQRYIPKENYIWSSISPYYLPLFGRFFWLRLKMIIKTILKLKNILNFQIEKILDIGCGFGIFSLNVGINLPNAKIDGIDILNKEENIFVRRLFRVFNQKCKISTSDIQNKTDFPNEYFDLIVALDVLEHVKKLEMAIKEIKRILKKNGKFIITVPTESKLLQFARNIYSRVSKRFIYNDHWKGDIKSFNMFNTIIKNNFKVNYFRRYPFSGFPLIFSYGLIYVLSKS